jgi:hypothetical protein
MARRTIAAIFFTYKTGGCKAVRVETSLWDEDKCREDALKRICRYVAPDLRLRSSRMHHNGSSSWAVYYISPNLVEIFPDELWQHPTVVCAPVSGELPANIKHHLARSF